MTCPDRAFEMIERFPEALVTEMGGIENNAEAIHFGEKFAATRTNAASGISALRVRARPIVRRANSTETLLIGAFKKIKAVKGIGAFEAEDITDGTRPPRLHMFFESRAL